MILEICANSYQSALNTEKAGAHRIELCAELSVGGVTPSFGLIKKVVEALTIPVFVLVRPRSGNFTYTNSEFEIMKQDIQICKDLGCSGIVSGVLNEDNSVDVVRTRALIGLSKPLEFTFHRAFDWVPNSFEAQLQLIDLGVNRILTSGQQPTAHKGLELLNSLKSQSLGKIKIMPGSGIHAENAKVFKNAGFHEIHTSASKGIIENNSSSFFGDIKQSQSSLDVIKLILEAIS